MFFNLFGPKKEEPKCSFKDYTYMTEKAKCDAITKFALNNGSFIFIVWFAETALFYKNIFLENGIDVSRVVDAKHYSSLKYPEKQIVLLEHYPLPAKEDEFIQQLQQKSVIIYNSVTDPIFRIFGGDKVAGLIKTMGIGDDEFLSHDMISKSIRNAQDKIAELVIVEKSAASQEEWIKRNFPEK